MPTTLRKLVSQDLLNLNPQTIDFIASSQVSNVLIHAFQQQHQEGEAACQRIKLNDPVSDAVLIFDAVAALAEKSKQNPGVHYSRLFLEKGTRAQGSLHYFAGFVRAENGKVKTLIIDQAIGYDTLQTARDLLTDGRLDLEYYVAGGTVLQKNYVSCLFYTLSSLEDVTSVPNLFEDLAKVAAATSLAEGEAVPTFAKIDWMDMPPQLVWNAQSLSFIWQYVERRKQQLASEDPSSPVSALMSTTNGPQLSFEEYISAGIAQAEDGRLLSDAINRNAVAHFASLGFNAFENIQDDAELIDIIYREDMVKINGIMKQLLGDPRFKTNELIEIFYKNPEKYEKALANDALYTIFSNKNIHELLQNTPGLAQDLLSACGALETVNKQIINKIVSNLGVAEKINGWIERGVIAADPQVIKQILTHNLAKAIFAHPTLIELIDNGNLSIESALNVIPFKIKADVLAHCTTVEEKVAYIEGPIVSPNNPKHKRKISGDLGASMAEVLKPQIVAEAKETQEKVAAEQLRGSTAAAPKVGGK